jgi:hypothetical protein
MADYGLTTIRITRENASRIHAIIRGERELGARSQTTNEIVGRALDALDRERGKQVELDELLGILDNGR